MDRRGAPLSDAVTRAAALARDPTRHAIEVRLAAEDPARAFAPSPGRIGSWQMPAGPGVRVDTAIRPGERVPPDYDPMIAKIMTVGRDRDAAIDGMRRALDEVEVTGIQTTLPFDRALMRDAAFAAGEISTDWVDAHWDGEAERQAAFGRAAAIAAGIAVGIGVETAAASVGDARSSLRKDATASTWRAAGRVAAIERRPR